MLVDLYNQYFDNGDEFMWVPSETAQFRLQIAYVNPDDDTMDLRNDCARLVLVNRFRKSENDVSLIYKILEDFDRGDENV